MSSVNYRTRWRTEDTERSTLKWTQARLAGGGIIIKHFLIEFNSIRPDISLALSLLLCIICKLLPVRSLSSFPAIVAGLFCPQNNRVPSLRLPGEKERADGGGRGIEAHNRLCVYIGSGRTVFLILLLTCVRFRREGDEAKTTTHLCVTQPIWELVHC